MRIPTSVIVMSVVTAIPFGLAIRDSLRHHDVIDDELDARGSAEAEISAHAAEPQGNDHEAAKAKLAKRLRGELYGAQPASLGSAFAGIELGRPTDPKGHPHLDDWGKQVSLVIELEPEGKPDRITISPTADEDWLCRTLGEQLPAVWGPSMPKDDVGTIWFDRTQGHIAWLRDDAGSCNLVFMHVIDPSAMFTRAADSIAPTWAFGGPAQTLRDQLPEEATTIATANHTDDALVWDVPGLGATTNSTRIEAELHDGKVTNMYISGDTDDATFAALEARLTKLYGTPKPDLGTLHWSHPAMTLERHGRTWMVGLGVTP